jgi:hypothetical protein
LEIQHFALMVGAPMGEPAGSAGTSTAEAPGKSSQRDNDERSALLAYAAAVQSLVQRLSEAAQALVDAALAFQGGQITVDELRQEFQRFAPVVREVSGQLNRLSPPPEAQSIHQKLAEGLGKCDQALDLMDNWLDSPNSNAKEGAALLVADCAERVTAAQEELMAFVNED